MARTMAHIMVNNNDLNDIHSVMVKGNVYLRNEDSTFSKVLPDFNFSGIRGDRTIVHKFVESENLIRGNELVLKLVEDKDIITLKLK